MKLKIQKSPVKSTAWPNTVLPVDIAGLLNNSNDVQIVVNAGGSTVTLTGNFISGTIHQGILDLFGISGPLGVEGSIALVLAGNIACTENGELQCSGQGFSGSADMGVTQIPEPASLALLGTGLLGLASRFRKKLSA